MTQSNYTRIILNIKDTNANFYENCLENRIINGIETKIFKGYLTYIPTHALYVVKKIMVLMILLNGIGKETVKFSYLKYLTIILFYY